MQNSAGGYFGKGGAEFTQGSDSSRAERDSLGAVNLLAEKEFREIEAQIADTQANIDEIKAAIDRLQTKIAHLNQEGRKRLRATFKDVDAQFQRLFTRIFGGGKSQSGPCRRG